VKKSRQTKQVPDTSLQGVPCPLPFATDATAAKRLHLEPYSALWRFSSDGYDRDEPRTSVVHNAVCEAEKHLWKLQQLAEEDNPDGKAARYWLANRLTTHIAWMNERAEDKPALWRCVSEQTVFWPVAVALHPHFIKGMERNAAVRRFLEQTLHLAEAHFIPFDVHAKSKLSSPFSLIACELIQHLEYTRRMDKRNLPNIRPGWRHLATELKPLNKSTAAKWADVATEAFLESYPHPEKIQELADEIGLHREDGITADYMSPGKLRDRILNRLRKAIRDIAPK